MQRRKDADHQLPIFPAVKAAPATPRPVPVLSERPDEEPQAISVGELDRRLKRLLEGSTADVHVEGEISGLKEPASGHAYFTLKDEREEASIECVMYRTAAPRARRLLKEGARVVLIGRATVYAPRGRLQFSVDSAKPAGRGALLEALERLKEKLAGEGLFAEDRKRALPREPRLIGVVTSADGAAIHDIVTVAFRRAPVRILLASAPVQGPGAASRIARALSLLARVPGIDAIIVGRGGGSADDLSAFNDEDLVRQIAACPVPVVSAVGHEIDVSLTDLVADARAATPSQAAEMLVPDGRARREAIEHLSARMTRALGHTLRDARALLDRQATRLGTPARLLAERRQSIDEARQRMTTAIERKSAAARADVRRVERRLYARHPRAVLGAARAALGPERARLDAAMMRALAARREALAASAARLDAMSPLAVLGRGYAIATGPAGRAILDPADVQVGDAIRVRVHRGTLTAQVTNRSEGDPR